MGSLDVWVASAQMEDIRVQSVVRILVGLRHVALSDAFTFSLVR